MFHFLSFKYRTGLLQTWKCHLQKFWEKKLVKPHLLCILKLIPFMVTVFFCGNAAEIESWNVYILCFGNDSSFLLGNCKKASKDTEFSTVLNSANGICLSSTALEKLSKTLEYADFLFFFIIFKFW